MSGVDIGMPRRLWMNWASDAVVALAFGKVSATTSVPPKSGPGVVEPKRGWRFPWVWLVLFLLLAGFGLPTLSRASSCAECVVESAVTERQRVKGGFQPTSRSGRTVPRYFLRMRTTATERFERTRPLFPGCYQRSVIMGHGDFEFALSQFVFQEIESSCPAPPTSPALRRFSGSLDAEADIGTFEDSIVGAAGYLDSTGMWVIAQSYMSNAVFQAVPTRQAPRTELQRVPYPEEMAPFDDYFRFFLPCRPFGVSSTAERRRERWVWEGLGWRDPADPTRCTENLNENCGASPRWELEDPIEPDIYLTRRINNQVWVAFDGIGRIFFEGTYSDEYTTDRMLAAFQADFPQDDLPLQEFFDGIRPAFLHLSDDASCVTGTMVHYRFNLETDRDTIYRIYWNEVTRFRDGRVISRPRSEDVVGQGPRTFSLTHRIPPPAQPGETTVENVSVRIVAPDGAVGAPGAGGPMGFARAGFPGCPGCGTGPAGAGSQGGISGSPGAPSFRIALGTAAAGRVSPALELVPAGAMDRLGSRLLAELTAAPSDLEVIRLLPTRPALPPELHQIRSADALTELVQVSPSRFEIRVHRASLVVDRDSTAVPPDGYAFSGHPWVIPKEHALIVTWSVEEISDPISDVRRWVIGEHRDGETREYVYNWIPTDAHLKAWLWTLDWPGGLRRDVYGTWIRPERKTRVEWLEVGRPGGPAEYAVERTYRQFDWGEGLIEEREGAEPDQVVKTWTYREDGVRNGTQMPLDTVRDSTGYWEKYAYLNGGPRLRAIYSPVGDSPAEPSLDFDACRVRQFAYADSVAGVGACGDEPTFRPDRPRLTEEYVLGHWVRGSLSALSEDRSTEIALSAPGEFCELPDDARARTVITRFPAGHIHAGRVFSIHRPDGSLTTFQYGETADGRTVRQSTGEPDALGLTVLNGTRVTTQFNRQGGLVARSAELLQDGAPSGLTSRDVVERHDEFGRPLVTRHLDGTVSSISRSCCGIEQSTDADGVVTKQYYDALGRSIATLRLGILTSNVLDAVGRVIAEYRVGTDGSVVRLREAGHDAAGRESWERNALGGLTVYGESTASGRRVRTVTRPDGGRAVETYFLDGQLAGVTGDAVAPVRYEHGLEDGLEYLREIRLDAEGRDTPEQVTRFFDGEGRPVREVLAAPPGQAAPVHSWSHGPSGQLLREIDPDGVSTLYFYTPQGELAGTAVEAGAVNGQIDWAGADRITATTNDVLAAGAPGNTRGVEIRRTRVYAWTRDQDPVSTLMETRESSLDGLRHWVTSVAGEGRTETIPPSADNGWTRTTSEMAPDGTTVTTVRRQGRTLSVTRRDAAGVVLSRVAFDYDAHGRLGREIDSRGAATVYAYNAADQVSRVTSPAPGDGSVPPVTETHYDASLRPVLRRQSGGGAVTNEYYANGKLRRTGGAEVYPVEYAYDAQGRLASMTTWRNAATGDGRATTEWRYDPYRGWLIAKVVPDEFGDPLRPGPSYAYTPGGRLQRRTWARGVTASYELDAAGDWSGIRYDDGMTPSVAIRRDRLGRPMAVERGGMVAALGYDASGVLTNESWAGGRLDGWRVGVALDARHRPVRVAVGRDGGGVPIETRYDYDSASRIRSVSAGTGSVEYEYLPETRQVSRMLAREGGVARLTTERPHDGMQRLAAVTAVPAGDEPVSHRYGYDAAGRRERVDLADGSRWAYAYDWLGQIQSARRSWSDGRPVAGQQFEYAHDDIGNRVAAWSGGDESGGGLRQSTYAVQTGNELVSRTVPGAVDILGLSRPLAGVSVNGRPASRHGEYFRSEVPADNQSGPIWLEVGIAAAGTNATNRVAGHVYVPPAVEGFVYDADGNLLRDGRWSYTWDAENRLVRMEALAPVGPWGRLEFDYDWQGRRIAKRAWAAPSGAGSELVSLKFLYRGWNLLLAADGTDAPRDAFTWGPDLSGSLEGSGGVGGLAIWTRLTGSGGTAGGTGAGVGRWFPAFDGGGHVVGLASAADGTWGARYEYGPFGELLRASGPVALVNPLRHATKWHDDETGLAYYGHRYYSPSLGRWISQDPAGEAIGGRNLHTFVSNDPVRRHDVLGLRGSSGGGGGRTDRGTARRLKRDGCCQVFTIKVDATGFDWSSPRSMVKSVSRHLYSAVGHSWVRLEGEGYVVEGGHSGETGDPGQNPRITRNEFLTYGNGVATLAGMSVAAAGPMPGVLEADPANPIRWLRYIYDDGHWAEGTGGHERVTTECSWCLGPGEFAGARNAIEALRSGDGAALKAYGLTGQQCTSTAAGIAEAAGIRLNPYVQMTFPPFMEFGDLSVRLWTDPQFASLSFALPDKLAFEIKRASGGSKKVCR